MIDLNDTQNLLDIHRRLARFGNELAPRSGYPTAETILLQKFVDCDVTGDVSDDATEAGKRVTLASMPRWLSILFPRRAAEQTGIFGTSILIEDLLTWASEGRDDEPAKYALSLAGALKGARVPRPVVEDPTERHRQRLANLLEVLDVCEANPQTFSPDEKLGVYMHLEDALRIVEFGEDVVYTGIDYPSDHLPVAGRDGVSSRGMMADVGWVLRKLMDRADYLDCIERQKVGAALEYFPDRNIEIEASLSGGAFLLFEPHVLKAFHEPLPHHLMLPAEGSVRLDHYGEGSAFSPVAGEYEFTLHRPAEHLDVDGEYEDLVFLVSDRLTYTMSCDRQ